MTTPEPVAPQTMDPAFLAELRADNAQDDARAREANAIAADAQARADARIAGLASAAKASADTMDAAWKLQRELDLSEYSAAVHILAGMAASTTMSARRRALADLLALLAELRARL